MADVYSRPATEPGGQQPCDGATDQHSAPSAPPAGRFPSVLRSWPLVPLDDGTVADAAKWRALAACPHVNELISDWLIWHERAAHRQASHAISAGCDWRRQANAPTFAELELRRATYQNKVPLSPPLTPAEIAEKATQWEVVS